ncbi:MAG: ABC transporter substrate-binding protein [Patescibacteria group bacterium]
MVLSKKQLRYYYWIVLEFTKKNARLLLLSFFISVIFIISIVSLSPYLINITTSHKIVVGLTGVTDIKSIPDTVLSKISNGLIFIDEKGKVVPILAERWEVINNGKEYKFYLRKNLFWNDGAKFTAHDINYSFKDIEIIVPNDYEIDFKLKKQLPIFPTYLTQPIIKRPLVGVAGLYKVERSKVKYGNVTELSLSPTKQTYPPIVYKFYDSESKLINAYKLGQINEMTITKKSVADIFSSWKNTEIVKTIDYSRLLTLFFNLNGDAFKYKERKELRQAIAMLLSHEDYKEQGELASSPIPPISWAFNASIHQPIYNEEFVQKMLRPSEKKTKITLSTYEDYLDIATNIQEKLANTSLKVDVNILTYDKPTSYDMLLAFWKVPADPDQYYYWHSTQTQGNITGYKSEKIDLLLEQGRETLDPEKRKEIYNTFQKVVVDDVPAYFFYYPYIYTIKRK